MLRKQDDDKADVVLLGGYALKTVVIGLGNPILTDDSVGIKAARLLRQQLEGSSGVEVVELHAGGLRLLDALTGYQRAIIIDATTARDCRPGTVRSLPLAACGGTRNLSCSHDTSLPVALELGSMLGCALPGEITIWGVEAQDVVTFGEDLTAEVQQALPVVVDRVLRALGINGRDGHESSAGVTDRKVDKQLPHTVTG